MLNKKEKEIIRDCAKDLYKLAFTLLAVHDGLGEELSIVQKITEKLEGLLDD